MARKAAIAVVAGEDSPTPPIARKRPYVVASPNGAREDDYYWLRDDSRGSKEVIGYLDAENAYTNAMLAPTQALQDELYAELVGRVRQDDASVPVLRRGWWYYTRYESGREYPIYARRWRTTSAREHVMLDGNALAVGKSFFQIGTWAVSPDGHMLAYAEDTVGRRQYSLRVKNLKTGEVLADIVANVEANVVWANDNRTLLYVEKDPVTLLSVRVRKHIIGSKAEDPLVYEERDHSYYMRLARSKSEKYLFISLRSTLQSEWRYADVGDSKLRFKVAIPREPNHEYQLAHLGGDFVVLTNYQAQNFRLVRAPIKKVANKKAWRDVLPARDDTFLQSFEVFKRHVAANERSGGLMKLHVKSWDGKRDFVITSTEPSYTTQLVPTPGIESTRVRYIYTSLTTPKTTYEYDMVSDQKTILKTEPVLGGFDSANYTTEYLHATADDGALVPISLAYRKGKKLDGNSPLYQYAYGSYGLSTDPSFQHNWVSLMDRGFVVAIAHVRGGQEKGRAWYEDGRLLRKKRTFTDFVAVTRYLVLEKYASKDKVFAQGGSAGGLLMGAIANLAPNDYRGLVADVPFVDIVTSMLDESLPLTTNEFDEWGNPKVQVYYDYMLSYSPYDNVERKAYPAMLVTSGLWDSQVPYWESAKWVAKLRATKTDSNLLLYKVNMEAGHGGKSGRFQRLRETALEYQFIINCLSVAAPS